MKHYHHHRVGAPLGNQNARKHGFYSKVLTAEQQAQFPRLAAARGLDNEIAVMRVKLFAIQEHTPDNGSLEFRVVRLLARMVDSQEKLSKRDLKGIRSFVQKYMPDDISGIGSIVKPAFSALNYDGVVSHV
jgi:hypothetical protein